MTEPVGYMYRKSDREDWLFTLEGNVPYGNYKYVKPVYTSEQLHPRVKMTKEQADDFKMLYADFNLLSDALNEIYGIKYLPMKSWIVNGKPRENEILIAGIWGSFDPDKPEETIEIVPDMKWFVRSKEKHDGVYIILANTNPTFVDDFYGIAEDDEEIAFKAPQFDTKEDAEKWTNPLTEAVQLPVEGE